MTGGAPDGLADEVAAVQAVRAKLGRDLDQLNEEVRAEMSGAAERTLWKLIATGAAIATGLVVRRVLLVLWRRVTGQEAPINPGAPDTTWSEGLVWAIASGAAIGVGRLVAARGATAGWEKVTGTLPPDVSDADR